MIIIDCNSKKLGFLFDKGLSLILYTTIVCKPANVQNHLHISKVLRPDALQYIHQLSLN